MSDYHWNWDHKVRFLRTIAETGNVTLACAQVSKSRQSAYALARRGDGLAFRFAWAAARIIARDIIADSLMERALVGTVVETIRDTESGRTVRTACEQKLGMALLSRLDRQVEDATGGEAQIAEIVAANFEAFIMLVEAGGAARDIEKFLKECRFSEDRFHCQLGQKDPHFVIDDETDEVVDRKVWEQREAERVAEEERINAEYYAEIAEHGYPKGHIFYCEEDDDQDDDDYYEEDDDADPWEGIDAETRVAFQEFLASRGLAENHGIEASEGAELAISTDAPIEYKSAEHPVRLGPVRGPNPSRVSPQSRHIPSLRPGSGSHFPRSTG